MTPEEIETAYGLLSTLRQDIIEIRLRIPGHGLPGVYESLLDSDKHLAEALSQLREHLR